jgi:rfaE bifunctional protein nucleotidyltransferase chain/domain
MFEIDSMKGYTSKKTIPFQKAKQLITILTKEKKKVGLCHGGYDLLHPGHIKHFESAKKLCDVLFVSVTSDRFVSERKGAGRPIFNEKLRAYSIAALESVDYVVISDFKRATEVIIRLKPSYYIKGPDFVQKTTPGITEERNAIKNNGGVMKYTRDPTMSTTKIIEYIKHHVHREKLLFIVDRDGTLIEEQEFLGKGNRWKDQVTLNTHVVDFLSFVQTKFDTILLVVTNQAGVAQGYFDCKRVEEVNAYIDGLLRKNRVTVHNWQYCPDVDKDYAEKMTNLSFKQAFTKQKTKRKPSTEMVIDALKELQMKLPEFTSVIVIGDRHEDAGLATHLHAPYIDVKGKTIDTLIEEFQQKCTT